jgi:hypothetical protein
VTGRGSLPVILLAAILASTSCSGTSDLDARTQRQLAAGVQEVRASVAEGDRLGARAALRDLTQAATSLTGDGRLDQDRAAEILAAAQDVADQLPLLQAPVPSHSPEPSSAAPAPPDDQGDPPEHSNGHSNGHAYGHDEDHGNRKD